MGVILLPKAAKRRPILRMFDNFPKVILCLRSIRWAGTFPNALKD